MVSVWLGLIFRVPIDVFTLLTCVQLINGGVI